MNSSAPVTDTSAPTAGAAPVPHRSPDTGSPAPSAGPSPALHRSPTAEMEADFTASGTDEEVSSTGEGPVLSPVRTGVTGQTGPVDSASPAPRAGAAPVPHRSLDTDSPALRAGTAQVAPCHQSARGAAPVIAGETPAIQHVSEENAPATITGPAPALHRSPTTEIEADFTTSDTDAEVSSTGEGPVLSSVRTGATGQTGPVDSAGEHDRWAGITLPAGYSINHSGVFKTDDSSRIAGPIWVVATTRDPLTGDHGIVLRWVDLHGVQCELAVMRDELLALSSGLPAKLARGGLLLAAGEERKLLRYLAQFEAQHLQLWQSATRVGWIEESDSALVFMMPPPAGLIAVTGHAPVIFQPERESPSTASMYARGNLKDWNQTVVALCRSNPLLLFPILVALSGPLLRFAGLESGGFHYYGRSSHGKTTAAQVAASVWGNGADPAEAPDRAFVKKWNATANAFEALLTAHNDTLLVLDEIHTCDAKDFGAVIYNMSGGKGRQALDRDRQLRCARKWRTMYFSTGEISALRRLQADGKEIHAGQLLRLIDIPIEGGTIIDALGGNAGTHADKLKAACARCFGTPGKTLIRELTLNYDDARALSGTVKTLMDHHAPALTPKDAPAEHQRAIKRFALLMVAGELAIKLGILECTMAQVERAVGAALQAWLTDGSNIPDRLRGVLNVRAFIERYESRFQKAGAETTQVPRDRAGFTDWDHAAGSRVYMFTSDGFAEACSGQDPRETAKELTAQGFMIARESGRYNEKRDLGSGRIRVYVVRASLLSFDPQSATAIAQDEGGATGAGGATHTHTPLHA